MKKAKNFTDLTVWQRGHELVRHVYQTTEAFPDKEKYGLVSQMRRASISITSNIAESFGRRSNKDKSRFFDISLGSTYELQNQLILSYDLELITKDEFDSLGYLATETAKLINAIRSANIKRSISSF